MADTCHLLGSCQMGKSSLRRRIQHRIESNRQGYCAAIDMKRIVRANTTANQWYQGIIFELLRNFGLRSKVNLSFVVARARKFVSYPENRTVY